MDQIQRQCSSRHVIKALLVCCALFLHVSACKAADNKDLPRTLTLDVAFAPQVLMLSAQEQGKLENFVSQFVKCTIKDIAVDAHVNKGGTVEYRTAIADRQANVVKDVLVSHGVAGNTVRTRAFAPSGPGSVSKVFVSATCGPHTL